MRNHHWRICLIVGLLVSLGLWMQPANANKSSDPNRLIEPSMGFEFAQLDQWIPSIFAENGPQTNSQVAQRSIGFVHRTTPSLLAIVSSFANPKALSSSGWIKRYDYRRTNAAYQIETIEWQKRSVQLISEHQLSRQAHGTPDHLRLIIAINQQIMVFEYIGYSINRAEFLAWLEQITLIPAQKFQASPLSNDVKEAFAQANQPLAVSIQNCCGVSDPEFNPFPCNSSVGNGNCTWWVRYRRTGNNIANLSNCTGNADTWDECAASSYPQLLSDTPSVKSAVVWTNINHVAFLEQVNSPTSITMSQMNWYSPCPQSTITQGITNKKFIRHPDAIQPEPAKRWHLSYNLSSGNAELSFNYGLKSDKAVIGDWNGDGIDTPGVVRGNTWYLSNTYGEPHTISFEFGDPNDIPVVGDWNGDGKDTPGLVRGTTWYISNNLNGGWAERSFGFGEAGDKPVVGDWNGDGKDSPGVVRGITWYLSNNLNGGWADISLGFGELGDTFIVGDWDGDGDDTPGVVRGNMWYLSNNLNGGWANLSFMYGDPGNYPIVGNWGDSDRNSEIGVIP
ncbi:MAG TPA: CHAP domain-containing protein [Herpetosiphon sp.]|uniref:CHAP domain containing protein n=1 Tax=Herpetosiphon aurantiacus (strain ATCC 23779 / DSM 785 / 114-95) TaxID=316274 RepID=A9AZB0_HERA2|nr:CHAP domain-containing protein [Herpetosiphon sp.]ABX03656.1 CHAP domain containing protein [Herpetosiphon aurantiacus DSM 785]HBW51466.1 CHAP domain-containing protein [Herpetosiphon sp.]